MGVDPLIGDSARVELGEERLEPERVLVEDADRGMHERPMLYKVKRAANPEAEGYVLYLMVRK